GRPDGARLRQEVRLAARAPSPRRSPRLATRAGPRRPRAGRRGGILVPHHARRATTREHHIRSEGSETMKPMISDEILRDAVVKELERDPEVVAKHISVTAVDGA